MKVEHIVISAAAYTAFSCGLFLIRLKKVWSVFMIGVSPLVLCGMQIEQESEEEIKNACSLQRALRQSRARISVPPHSLIAR